MNHAEIPEIPTGRPAVPEPFAPHTAEYARDPHGTLDRLRAAGPLLYWPPAPAWLLTDHAACVDLLRDTRFTANPRRWRHRREPSPEELQNPVRRLMEHGLFALAPRDHARLRKLVNPSFTARAVERHRERIAALVQEALDAVDPSAEFDWVKLCCEPVPVRVISHLLEIPRAHEEVFGAFASGLIAGNAPGLSAEAAREQLAGVPDGIEMLQALIEERRGRRGDDLLSELIRAEEDGDRLRPEELVSLVGQLLAAGAETTTHLLSFGTVELLRHPDQLALVRTAPELFPAAVDETLRHEFFMTLGLARFALEDVELCDQKVLRGEMVQIMMTLIHRDPVVFPDPHRFDLKRDQRHSLPFGFGPHYCLGAALARLQAAIGLEALFSRFPRLELAAEPQFRPHPLFRQIGELRLRPAP